MDLLTLDFETYYDKDYGLKKLTTEEYVRDDRFETIMVGIKINDGPVATFDGAACAALFSKIDWPNVALLCHNTAFDGFILKERYGVVPAMYLDTYSMANARQDGVKVGGSLAFLVEKYNIGEKGKEVLDALGKHRADFSEEEWAAYRGYCANDVELTYKLFQRLKIGFPLRELQLIDMTIRMYCDPVLELDNEMLSSSLDAEHEAIAELLDALGVEEADLASNAKFAEVLKKAGYEPPMKVSPTTGKEMYAFAKNDAGFQALMKLDAQAELLCRARMHVKSTQKRTRSKRFVDISSRGKFPIPLKYWGAITGRWSGSEKLNVQNLKRGSELRKAILAPEGYTLVVSDLSQIEPRVLAWLAGDQRMLSMLRSDDPYSLFGAKMFGIPNLNKKDHPELRQAAKSALLGCGYGLGYVSFASQLMTGFMGAPPVLYDLEFGRQIHVTQSMVDGYKNDKWFRERVLELAHTCSDDALLTHAAITAELINKYRDASPEVVEFWRKGDEAIKMMAMGQEGTYKCLQIKRQATVLPSGMSLLYPNLQPQGRNYVYGAKNTKLYGSKWVENVVQAVARIVMSDAMLRIKECYRIVSTVHDEVVVLVGDDEVDEAKNWIHNQMLVEPEYLPAIPLAAETDSNKRYGECK